MRKSELNLIFVLIIILYVIIWLFLSFRCFFFLFWLFNEDFYVVPMIMCIGVCLFIAVLQSFCKVRRFHPIVTASIFVVLSVIISVLFYAGPYSGSIKGDYIIYYESDIVRDKFGNVVFQTDKDIDRVSFDGMVYFSDETRAYSLKTKEWIYPN